MLARFSSAMLGLLAFAIVTMAGLYVQNPVTVTLSRGILALFLFSFIGFVLGWAAQTVVAEYTKAREAHIDKRYHNDLANSGHDGMVVDASGEGEAAAGNTAGEAA